MKYKVKQETRPNVATFGKYKAVAVHERTIDKEQLQAEIAQRSGLSIGNVINVMQDMGDIVNEHLRQGDKVWLDDWGMMKLEIESDKVDNPEDFQLRHIRGVRIHFLAGSRHGSQAAYEGIRFDKSK